jgi:hypothetical protein
MLAFVLAGISAFLCIDALKPFLQETGSPHTRRTRDICLFILGRSWKAGLVVIVLRAIAASIESWVTPGLVGSALQASLNSAW